MDETKTIMDATKVGARNNRMDKETIQKMHDAAVQLGAECEPMEDMEKSVDPESLVFEGAEVKAVGNGKVAGYLIRYGNPKNADLEGDFFNAGTDYGVVDGGTIPIYYQHGFDGALKNRRIGRGVIKFDDVGLWLEAQLEMRDEYEKMLYDLAEKGKLGWSSGAAGHLVEREQVGKAYYIKTWPIAEGSLTPTPAEPRNTVTPLKSLSVIQQVEAEPAAQDKRESEQPETNQPTGSNAKGVTMEITEEKLQEMLTEAAEAGSKKAIEATEPVNSAGVIPVTTDEADRPFKTLAEQAIAVKNYYTSLGRTVDPRIKRLQAMEAKAVQGASEGVPTDGGILLEPTLTAEVIKPIHEEGPFANAVRKLPVSNNSNSGWINGVDETSRETGSRWGGLRGYRLAEGETVTKSKPKFRRIQWELKKYGVLVYDTNELLRDAAQFAAIVEQGSREEIGFMLNDDILNGLGVAGPQGIMQSGALISVARNTASTIKGDDISNMWMRLSLRSKARANFYINPDCSAQLDSLFAVGSTSVLYPYASYRDGVRTLYGRPIIETEFNPSLNTSGDILLADLNEYLLWEKGNVEMATSMHVEFLTDQEVIRFIYRADGQTALASALTPYKGSNNRSPFVVLGSASA